MFENKKEGHDFRGWGELGLQLCFEGARLLAEPYRYQTNPASTAEGTIAT
jgi:hypothetical protein